MTKKPKQSIEERRKTTRVKQILTVVYCSPQYLLKTNALSRDISEDGICLLTPYELAIGETMELGIYLPGAKKPIATVGEVVRKNKTDDINLPYLLGIKFIKIDPEAYQKIRDHIHFYMLKTD